MTHIKRITFCGLRRLHPFSIYQGGEKRDWMNCRQWHNFGKVNVFIGANGAGKSTILELVDSLRQPGRLATLGRENRTSDSQARFEIEFSSRMRLKGEIVPNRLIEEAQEPHIDAAKHGIDIQHLTLIGFDRDKPLFYLSKNVSKIDLHPETVDDVATGFALFGATVGFWDAGHRIRIEDLVTELNLMRHHLPGVLSENECLDAFSAHMDEAELREKPFEVHGDDRVKVYLSDDISQYNHVHVSALPAGWKQVASVLSWLRSRPKGGICLLEEPETHLHPRLQRYLAKSITSIVDDPARSLQVFMTTHSSVFQQMSVWPKDAKIFEARADRLCELTDAWRVLDALGVRGSDVSQSNGVIWIEGASDRLYIKHWLELFCRANNRTLPVEDLDYSFSTYGGSSLSHFGLAKETAYIGMLGVNRNAVIVMDQDLDFTRSSTGKLLPLKSTSAKARILDELDKLARPSSIAWVTDGYTIESYLPEGFRSTYFSTNLAGRLLLNANCRKIDAALDYIETYKDWRTCSAPSSGLAAQIERVLLTIEAWNQ